jgi:hypothetical protein
MPPLLQRKRSPASRFVAVQFAVVAAIRRNISLWFESGDGALNFALTQENT